MYFLDAPTYSHWPAREITPAQEDHTEDKFKKKKKHDTFPLNKWILFSIYQKWSFLRNFLNQTLIKHNYVFLRGEIILSYLTLLCLI